MKKINISKLYLFTGLALLAMIFGFVIVQNIIVNVSAQISPIAFMGPDIDFDVVFPGEILGKNFYVQASSDYTGFIPYTLTTQVKPRHEYTNEVGWGPASDYCLANPTDYEKCYPLLCPYLNIVSEEIEGDIDSDATLKEIDSDTIDYWTVVLNVPQLQEEYGCDVKLNLGTEDNGNVCDYDTVCETGENCENCSDCGCGGDEEGEDGTPTGGGGYSGITQTTGEVAGATTENTGEVLGESITQLPETGSSKSFGFIWLISLVGLIITGSLIRKEVFKRS